MKLRIVAGLLGLVALTVVESVARAQIVLPPVGYIDTVAGNGTLGYSGDGGPATSAESYYPTGVTVDSSGNIYFAEYGNSRIRAVSASTGIITTVAGSGTQGYSGDGGPAASAELNTPVGVAVDSSGNIYIADKGNARVRKVTASTGIITTVAGNGINGGAGSDVGEGGPATSAELVDPTGVALDSLGNIYIADQVSSQVKKVTISTGIITTVAGSANYGFSGDGGPATSAELYWPTGIALDSVNNIYIVDQIEARVRKVTVSTGIITTVAGNGTQGFAGDGGPATSAELNGPVSVALDSLDNIYIGDFNNNRVRKVSASSGIISTVAGDGIEGSSGDGGLATSAELNTPFGVVVEPSGALYFGDTSNNRVRAVGQSTPVTVSCTPNPIIYGSATACTASIGGASPTGAVEWRVNGSAWETDTLSGASNTIDGLSASNAGSYNIEAAYSGDGSNFPGAGVTTINIEKATPNVSVSCSPNPIVFGGANSICSIYASLNGAVTGTVSLVIDGAVWTTLALSSGSATAQFPSTYGIGTFTLGATYNGDINNNPASGLGTVTVEEATPTLAVSTSGTPSTYGSLVTFTATVSNGPTGTVTFYDGGSFIGTGTISGTTATLSTSALLAGSHSISASWAGNSDFMGATSSAITQTVGRASVAIDSASTLSPSVYGDNVAWTFTVTGSGITPTGTVTISDGGNTLATISLDAGIATYDASALIAGKHTLTAVYSGDNNYQ